MAKLLHGLSRAAPGLVALRPTLSAESLRPGMLLKLGGHAEELHAALLCWRGGVALAAAVSGWPHSPRVHTGEVPDDAKRAELVDGVVSVCPEASDAASAAGLPAIIDCFGNLISLPIEDCSGPTNTGVSKRLPLMATSPAQADLQPIHASLHTGTAAVDVLTPIGRGQTMLMIGPRGTGKSSIVLDAIIAQAATSVSCILALSVPDAKHAADITSWLCDRADAYMARNQGQGILQKPLRARLTVIAPRSDSAAEHTLVTAAACALGERIRNSGGHSLVVLDTWRGPCEVWDEAGAAASGFMNLQGAHAMLTIGDEVDQEVAKATRRLEQVITRQQQNGAEQRVFYGAMLQRAAQLSNEAGGGSLTMLATLDELERPPSNSSSQTSATARDQIVGSPTFALVDFERRPRSQRVRLEALVARGIPLTENVLERIGIPLPAVVTSNSASKDDAAVLARLRHLNNWSHLDQLKSLADGHIQLRSDVFALGHRPAIRPHESIARVGVGSDATVRPQPWSAAMMGLARSLRLELAQAADLTDSSDAHSTLQRTRTRALGMALCTQVSGSPRPLADEIALLLALIDGHLDHLATANVEMATGEVDSFLAYMRASSPRAMSVIDETGKLDLKLEEELRTTIRSKLPKGIRRGLFVSWDTATASK